MTALVRKISKTAKKEYDADLLWRVAWTYIHTVINTVREPFLVLDAELYVLSANKTFYQFFGVAKKDTEGTSVYKLGDGQWNIPSLRKLLEKILPKNTFFSDYEVDHEFPNIGRKIIHLNARRIFTSDSARPMVLLAMEDATKQKELEEKLRDYTAKLNTAISVRTKELELRVQQLEELNRIL